MTRIVVPILLGLGVCNCIQTKVFPILPQASGYIYRSDNDGPGSLIQLGTHQNILQYKQPPVFALTIPLHAQPFIPVNNHLPLNPVVFPKDEVVAIKPVVEDEENEDEKSLGDIITHSNEEDTLNTGTLSDFLQPSDHYKEEGNGKEYSAENHASKDGHDEEGYNSQHSVEEGESGHQKSENEAGHYEESKGEKGKYHDDADEYGHHEQAAGGHHSSDWAKKDSHSKGEDVEGYHKIFHKDEFKKDRKFYDIADEGGSYKKYGNHHGYHKKGGGAYKKGGKYHSGQHETESGRQGQQSKGYHESKDAGYAVKEGEAEDHYNQADYGNRAEVTKSKEYGFSEGN